MIYLTKIILIVPFNVVLYDIFSVKYGAGGCIAVIIYKVFACSFELFLYRFILGHLI